MSAQLFSTHTGDLLKQEQGLLSTNKSPGEFSVVAFAKRSFWECAMRPSDSAIEAWPPRCLAEVLQSVHLCGGHRAVQCHQRRLAWKKIQPTSHKFMCWTSLFVGCYFIRSSQVCQCLVSSRRRSVSGMPLQIFGTPTKMGFPCRVLPVNVARAIAEAVI